MQSKFILVLLVIVLVLSHTLNLSAEDNASGQINGRVISELTESPVQGITVRLVGTQLGAITKKDGSFTIKNIPIGIYSIQFSGVGYNQYIESNVSINNVKPAQVEIKLSEKIIELKGVDVRGSYFLKKSETVTSTQSLNSEDIRKMPGVNEDVLAAISILPGVGIAGPGRNDLLVRGGAPFENLFIVDNIEIPNIYHFGSQGGGGGPLSLINIDFVKNVSFSSGGFGSKYGDKLSSITNINLRNGNEDKFGGKAILSATGFGLYFEGPIGKDVSYLISARRSYLDLIFKAAGLAFIPQYWDFTAKINYRIDENNILTFLTIGALDNVTLNNSNNDNVFKNSSIAAPNQDQYFSGLSWKYLFGNGFSTITLGRSYVNFNTYQNDSNLVQIFKNKSIEGENSLKAEMDIMLSPKFELAIGNVLKFSSKFKYDILIPGYLRTDQNGIPQQLQTDTSLNILKNSTYFSLTTSFGQNKITFGSRLDYFNFTDTKLYVSPRLSAIYQINPVSALILSAGRYVQSPSYIWLIGAPNQKLNPMIADQIVIGYEHTPLEDIKVQLELFYKKYTNYPARIFRPQAVLSPSGFDDISYDIPYGLEPLNNDGKGRSYGAELIIQKKITPELPIFGVFSVSYSDTRFTSIDGIERVGAFDSPLIMNLSVGYRFSDSWELSLKYRTGIGYPTTPFLSNGTRDFTKYNEGDRLPIYHATDIRLDKRWNLDRFYLVTYIDIQNAFGTKNVTDVRWNFRKQEIEYGTSFGVLPSIGIQFEF